MRNRVGLGFDVHPFGDAPPLVLGGVRIADAPRLAGHSDGDAVAHAVADAFLGPAGLPDLGTLFPETDESLRDADSLVLLAEVAGRWPERGWWIDNVDIVIAAEARTRAAHGRNGGDITPCWRREGTDGSRHQRVGAAEAGRRARRDRPGRRDRGLGRRACSCS